MTISAAVGLSRALEAHQAGQQAAHQALERLSRGKVAFGWVIASHFFPLQQVLAGINEVTGDMPFLGFSTSAELTNQGQSSRSVAVGLLAGDDLQVQANWWPDFAQDSRLSVQNMIKALKPGEGGGNILLAATDGLNGDAAYLCAALSAIDGLHVAGCLAGGDLNRGKSFQLGGRAVGSGGLAAALLGGEIVMGAGADHGWQPVGAVARLTRVQSLWVRTIDERHAGDLYERLFGYEARDWTRSPLNDLVRQYPLGVKEDGNVIVRSPLRIDVDGSLRMHTVLPEGQTVDLLVGSPDYSLQAARRAAKQALEALGPTTPRLAVLLVDAAWQTLFEMQPGAEVRAVQEVLGEEVPIIGGYTFGQIIRPDVNAAPLLLNQHLEVILFGENVIDQPDEVVS